MIRYIFIFLILGLIQLVFGQSSNDCTIQGKVTDANTGEPLHLVNVYLSGTTFGASTSVTGIYCMERVPAGSYQLIFQHIGYTIDAKNIQVEDNQTYQIDARLQLKIFDTDEIQIITTEPEEWQDQLEFFVEEFIGESDNAQNCEILNPEVLNFNVDPESNQFMASTDSVLRIKNNSLGYIISVVLVDFRCKDDYLLTFSIYPRFELLEAINEEVKEDWDENRRTTFVSSSKHFFSTLARRKIMEENFSMLTADNINWLKRGHGTYVDGEYLRIEDTRSPLYKKFYYSGFMAVSYSPEHMYKPSIIHFSRNYIIIDTLGNNLAPEFVSFAGDWYDRRVADLLPMEYIPDN